MRLRWPMAIVLGAISGVAAHFTIYRPEFTLPPNICLDPQLGIMNAGYRGYAGFEYPLLGGDDISRQLIEDVRKELAPLLQQSKVTSVLVAPGDPPPRGWPFLSAGQRLTVWVEGPQVPKAKREFTVLLAGMPRMRWTALLGNTMVFAVAWYFCVILIAVLYKRAYARFSRSRARTGFPVS